MQLKSKKGAHFCTMRVGLFFGTFNPIHVGHLLIAQSALNSGHVDKVWFIVSPNSPDKDYNKLLHEFDRFDLVYEATRDHPDFKVLDIEFHLPKPSYTYLTLRKLKSDYPENTFFILMGSDNFKNLSRWKNVEEIRQSVRFLVYPRPGQMPEIQEDELVQWIDAPLMEISATAIRHLLKGKGSARYLIPEPALKLIEKKAWYKN
jgi:nicotinate-nucleotide adenylyltransferase